MSTKLRFYKRINAFACDHICATGFREDRRCGLIYGPYRFNDGTWAKSWEEASRKDKFCAYCRKG